MNKCTMMQEEWVVTSAFSHRGKSRTVPCIESICCLYASRPVALDSPHGVSGEDLLG